MQRFSNGSPTLTETYDVAVLGAGPAGLTANLYSHRSGLKVLMLGGQNPGGQVTLHHRVENYPGFPGGVTGAELMTRWLKQVIDEIGHMPMPEEVTAVDLSDEIKVVSTLTETYKTRSVIVATGSKPRRLSVPGESEFEGKGVFFCATCDAPLLRTMSSRRAAVIGGGDTALHTGLALIPHAESVTIVSRGSDLRATPALVERFTRESTTKIILQRAVMAVVGEKNASGLVLVNTISREKETFPVDAVFVGVGQSPVTSFLGNGLALNAGGFIITDSHLRTSLAGVFAAGDVRDTPLRQIVTAAADGAIAASSTAEYLRSSSSRQAAS